MKRIAVCGGRDYHNMEAVHGAMDTVKRRYGEFILVSGNARGADLLAELWAIGAYIPIIRFPADWHPDPADPTYLDKGAGPKRNAQMVGYGLDGLVAFPGARGTKDMTERCRKAGVPIWYPKVPAQ